MVTASFTMEAQTIRFFSGPGSSTAPPVNVVASIGVGSGVLGTVDTLSVSFWVLPGDWYMFQPVYAGSYTLNSWVEWS
jgi:hypothetical protein